MAADSRPPATLFLPVSEGAFPPGVEGEPAVPPPPVVGIGASAGGLGALKALIETIPERTGVAFVVVVHLLPDHDSHLAELLQPVAAIPVVQIRDEIPLRADHVYIIPPGRNLSTIDSSLKLSQIEERPGQRAPIDHFFRTLAKTHSANSVGVILTGTGSDGTLGIQEIKGRGGLTIVQDPAEAEYDGMPQSAITTGIIDLILPVTEMVERIVGFLRTQPQLSVVESQDENAEDPRSLVHRILALVRTSVGSDFTRYKQSTIMRRIRRRMQLAHLEELEHYLAKLHAQPEEVKALANDFLITVTSFFRDRDVFEQLEKQIIPKLFRHKASNEQLRVWSVGCATGEEAYSLAMLLLEEADRQEAPPQIQVFASDLHDQSLRKAREGLYPGDIETDVSSERLRRFFRKENGAYRIRNEVREMVVFAPHNLLIDPPFSKIDLIVCRNLLIYLQRNLQPNIIELFHYALKPRGWLVLGTAETLNNSDLFSTESKSNGTYRKRNVPLPEPRLPVFPFTRPRSITEANQAPLQGEPLSYGALHHRMVERYAPPSILVSSENKVVHLSEHAGRYLQHPGGMPTTSVYKLVRDEFQVELRAALSAVREQRTPVTSTPVPVNLDGATRQVVIHARPNLEDDSESFVLVIFDEREESHVANAGALLAGHSSPAATRELETELELAKRRLKAAIEEYETSQEEMHASNEELQSANEELRSTLEELETSKEELQSINEELQTANQENRHKVMELSQLSDDLQHLMAATHIATLFLDRQLRILRFTPQIGELFSLRVVDRGRPLSDLTHRLYYDDLMSDAAKVLEQLVPVEREARDEMGRWYLVRMRPYRTGDDRIDGVVLTFVDITARKLSEEALRRSELRYRVLFDAMDEGFVVLKELDTGTAAPDFCVLEANPAFSKHTGLKTTAGQKIRDVAPEQLAFWVNIVQRLDATRPLVRFDCEPGIFKRWLDVCAYRLPDVEGSHVAVLLKDITEQKCSEAALREVDERKDEFLAVLSHELRNPLASIMNGLHILEHAASTSDQANAARSVLRRQVALLARLVDDLLDLTRINRGKIQLKCAPVELNQLLNRTLDDHRSLFTHRGLSLEFIPAPADVWVSGDASRLMQVFGNLLQNCAKFTPDGGRTSVALAADYKAAQAEIRVSDTGVGMTEEVLGQLFQPFMQGEQTLERSKSGLGLGLALTKRLLELHRGQIEASSAGLGKGTEFRIRLPLDTLGAVRTPSGTSPAYVTPRRVLIIEDNVDAAETLREVLQFCGHEVRIAFDSDQGMVLVQEFRPVIIFCDLGLPGRDGWAFARALKEDKQFAGVYLVALSGYAMPADCERALAAGFDLHLAKPADLARLQQVFVGFDQLKQ